MRGRLLFVAGLLFVSPAAAQTAKAPETPDNLPGKGLYDSSIQLVNTASLPFTIHIRPEGRDWRDVTIPPKESTWISCGDCVTSGFEATLAAEVTFGAPEKERDIFLPTGYRFKVKWLEDRNAWDIYVLPWE